MFPATMAIEDDRESNTSANGRVPQHVYLFSEVDKAEAFVGGEWEKVRALLGGKGANLAEMASIGLPVPPGFTISTEVCTYFYDHERRLRRVASWTRPHETYYLRQLRRRSGDAFLSPDPSNCIE